MRLFSYQDSNKNKRVGLLRDKDSSEFIDLSATDANLPNTLLEIIASIMRWSTSLQLQKILQL